MVTVFWIISYVVSVYDNNHDDVTYVLILPEPMKYSPAFTVCFEPPP